MSTKALEPSGLHPSDGIPRAAFTPGPWSADVFVKRLDVICAIAKQLPEKVLVVRDDRRFWVAAPFDRATGETEANMRLMAAAPELYEAVAEHLHAYDTGAKCCLDNLRSALAKARGDQ